MFILFYELRSEHKSANTLEWRFALRALSFRLLRLVVFSFHGLCVTEHDGALFLLYSSPPEARSDINMIQLPAMLATNKQRKRWIR